jgi:hypothetical protein
MSIAFVLSPVYNAVPFTLAAGDLSIREQLEEVEFEQHGIKFRLDSLTGINGCRSGVYLALFTRDSAGETDRLLPYWIDSPSSNVITLMPFDTFRIEGVPPELRWAFVANADSDSDSELIIQIGWHYDDINMVGWFYNTYVYDFDANLPGRLKRKESGQRIIPNEAEGNRQGERLHAKYNTEARIRRRLKQLGYK